MKRLTTRSILTATAIRDMEDFTTSGSLYGRGTDRGDHPWNDGRLTGGDQERWRNDCADITYAVFSYSTPIAWYTPDRGWYKVRAKFSPTTTKHQGNLYLIKEEEEVSA